MTPLASEEAPRKQSALLSGMSAFEAHPLLRGFHRMTFAAMFIRGDVDRPMPPAEERLFDVDEETRVLALCSWQRDPAPVLIIVHGFGGHADRPYMRGTARKAFASGFHVVRLNMRNCGGTEHLAGSMYHAGLIDDLAAVVGALEGESRCMGIHLAGFSMGGNVVLRLGGVWGAAAPRCVASIVAVSPVLDLAYCADNLDRQRSLRLYRNSFLRGLRSVYDRRAEIFPDRYEANGMDGVRTLRAFDERITAPDCGFSSVEQYYAQASSLRQLDRLRIPSLVLHARDDLLVPFPRDQMEALEAASAVQLLQSEHGGHCGFVAGRPPVADVDRYWAENRLVEFVDQIERAGRSNRQD
jgi:predicted alpha/beta-fold hydrolase